MRGRKPKLTAEVFSRIVDLVRIGNHLETAASTCGIHRSTLHRWLEKGEEQARGIYRQFLVAVEKAQGEAEHRDLVQIAKAAQTDWRAAAWRLERRFPRKYGTQVQATVREEIESMLAHLEKALDAETFQKVLRALDTASLPPTLASTHGRPAEDPRKKLLARLAELASPKAANGDARSPAGGGNKEEEHEAENEGSR
jgi:transposase